MRRVLKKSGQLGKTNCDSVIRVYDEAGNVTETHEQAAISKSRQRESCLEFRAKQKSGHACEA
jgi:hypothetical protein